VLKEHIPSMPYMRPYIYIYIHIIYVSQISNWYTTDSVSLAKYEFLPFFTDVVMTITFSCSRSVSAELNNS